MTFQSVWTGMFPPALPPPPPHHHPFGNHTRLWVVELRRFRCSSPVLHALPAGSTCLSYTSSSSWGSPTWKHRTAGQICATCPKLCAPPTPHHVHIGSFPTKQEAHKCTECLWTLHGIRTKGPNLSSWKPAGPWRHLVSYDFLCLYKALFADEWEKCDIIPTRPFKRLKSTSEISTASD